MLVVTSVPLQMSPDEKHVVVDQPLCLEEGQRYEIVLTFDQYDNKTPEPKASILIDSVSPPADGLSLNVRWTLSVPCHTDCPDSKDGQHGRIPGHPRRARNDDRI